MENDDWDGVEIKIGVKNQVMVCGIFTLRRTIVLPPFWRMSSFYHFQMGMAGNVFHSQKDTEKFVGIWLCFCVGNAFCKPLSVVLSNRKHTEATTLSASGPRVVLDPVNQLIAFGHKSIQVPQANSQRF